MQHFSSECSSSVSNVFFSSSFFPSCYLHINITVNLSASLHSTPWLWWHEVLAGQGGKSYFPHFLALTTQLCSLCPFSAPLSSCDLTLGCVASTAGFLHSEVCFSPCTWCFWLSSHWAFCTSFTPSYFFLFPTPL